MFKKIFVLMCILSVMLTAEAFAGHKQRVVNTASGKAVAAARVEVGEAPVMYGYKEKDGRAIINFRDNEAYLEYEVEVVLNTSKVEEMEIKGSNIAGSTTVKLTEADIRELIMRAYPDARMIKISKEREGVNTYYEAEFVTAKYKVEADMNPFTGAFAKREYKYF
ncbi:MAG: hypothetical protein SPI71_07045 [Acidaminococcaceae bacterium]|nr:hypothetical protein [Acidaminococcaceae bacterium]